MAADFDDETIAEQNGDPPQDSDDGDGGGVFDGAFGDLLEEAYSFNKQARDIKESAENGGWAISEEGMNEYKKACDTFLDRYLEMLEKARYLERRVKLGSSPYAYAIADFNIKVANGDENSLLPNLKLMKDGYEQLKQALEQASKNFDENENSAVQQLGQLAPKS